MLYELVLVDGEPVFAWISPSAREILELDPNEVLTDTHALTRLIHPDDLASHEAAPVVDGTWRWRGRQVLPSGRVIWVDAASRAAGDGRVQGVIIDVTRQVELEQQLVEAQRGAAVGLLAASIAHELNDPLTFLRNNLSWVLEAGLELSDQVRDALNDALEGSHRVEGIARTLSALPQAHRPYLPARCTLDEVVTRARRRLASERGRLELDCVTPDLELHNDAQRLAEALVHLATNLQRRRVERGTPTRVLVSGRLVDHLLHIELRAPSTLQDADVGCVLARLLLEDCVVELSEGRALLSLPA